LYIFCGSIKLKRPELKIDYYEMPTIFRDFFNNKYYFISKNNSVRKYLRNDLISVLMYENDEKSLLFEKFCDFNDQTSNLNGDH
jgi:hypothetical protein